MLITLRQRKLLLGLSKARNTWPLGEKNIKVARSYIGNFMTSMDMAGFSITLYKVDDERLKLLDQEVDIVRK